MSPIDLPTERGSATEWTSDSGTSYRFTNSAQNEWIVQRAHDHSFLAHLHAAGSTYDLITEKGHPTFAATAVSINKALSLLA